MERRKILKLLGLSPSIFIYSCIDPKVPSTPTIVTGMVIDENDIAIEGVSLMMTGMKQKKMSAVDTFNTDTITDKNGKFTLSYLIPKGTNIVTIQLLGSAIITDQTYRYYFQKDGTRPYTLMASLPEIGSGSYGKTTTLNFQLKKR